MSATGVGENWLNYLGNCRSLSTKTEHGPPCDTTTSPPGAHPSNANTSSSKGRRVGSPVIVPNQKLPKCLSTAEWENRLGYYHLVKYFVAARMSNLHNNLRQHYGWIYNHHGGWKPHAKENVLSDST